MLLACLALAEYSALVSERLLHFIGEKYGGGAERRVARWQTIMNENRSEPVLDQLNLVNHFFNKIPWKSDMEHWHQRDYWATPLEMLATNGGDCEDYAIGKYFTLRELGIPTEKLRITYVIALNLNQAHMVLAYYDTPDADPLILDNLNEHIMPASVRKDLQPVYGFNGDGLWMARQRGEELRQDNSSNFQWRDLNARLTAEMENDRGSIAAGKP